MNEHLLAGIEEKVPSMSKGNRLIARYIIDNYDKAAYMTAARIGEAVGVCEATVVRFAKTMGYSGYPEFKQAMQTMTRNRLNHIQRIELTDERISGGDIISAVMNSDIEMIRSTIENTSREQFSAAVDVICSAKRIYVIGTRSAAGIASTLSYYLSLMFPGVIDIDPSNESAVFGQLLDLCPEDVVIGVSFPRYSRRAVRAMRFASDRGARCIALTDSAASPMAESADYLLLAHSGMASIADSLVAPLSLVNALLVATSLRCKDSLGERFEQLEHIWEDYGVYEKSPGGSES